MSKWLLLPGIVTGKTGVIHPFLALVVSRNRDHFFPIAAITAILFLAPLITGWSRSYQA